MAYLRKVIYKIVDSALTGEESAKLTHSQARELMKIGLQAVRVTKKVAGEHNLIAVHNAWNTDALRLLIERVEQSAEYKKASGLLQVMKQMRALIGDVQKESIKNAERAAEGLPPKQQIRKEIRKKRRAEEVASAGDEGDENREPKKKRIKKSKGVESP